MVKPDPSNISNAVHPSIVYFYTDGQDPFAVYDIKLNDDGWPRIRYWDDKIKHLNPREVRSYRPIKLNRVRTEASDYVRYEISDNKTVANMVKDQIPDERDPIVVEHKNGKYGVEIDE